MAMTVAEIKDWLNSLEDHDEVGIDDGGLTLQAVHNAEIFFEIGGIPEVEEE